MRKPLGLLVAYVVVALGSLQLASVHISSSPVWPPAGLAIGALALWGLRLWPAVFVGAVVANAVTSGHVPSSLAIAAGNTLEAVAGGWLVRKFDHLSDHLGSLGAFALGAAGTAGISAGVGVSALVLFGLAPSATAGSIALTWWLGNWAGTLLVVPVLLAVHRWIVRDIPLLIGGAAAGAIAFSHAWALVAAIPIVLLLALAQRRKHAAPVAVLGIAAGSVAMTLLGRGPFWAGDGNQALLLLQVSLIVTSIAALLLSAGRNIRQAERPWWSTAGMIGAVMAPIVIGAMFVGGTLSPALHELDKSRIDAEERDVVQAWQLLMDQQAAQLASLHAFMENADVSQADFQAYVEATGWQFGPGLSTAVGYAPLVASDDVAQFEMSVRNDTELPTIVRNNFSIFPPSEAPLRAPVLHVYPMDPSPGAIGFDLLQNETRATSLLASQASHEIAASAPVDIVRPSGHDRGMMLAQSIEQNGSVVGFVISALALPNAASAPASEPGIGYQIVDVETGRLLFTTGADANDNPTILEVGGREWQISFAEHSQATVGEQAAPWFIIASTGVMSAAVGLVVYAYDSSRDRAIRLGNEMAGQARRDEQRLAEIKRLEELDAFRTQFLNMVAHELRTPLTPIRTQAYLLKRAGHPDQEKSLDILERGVLRLAAVVDDLLVAAKAEAGELSLELARTELHTVAEEALIAHQETADKQGTTLRVEGDAVAFADAARVAQILDNLVSNALRFTGGGNVTIQLAKDHDCLVRVIDDGAGIPRDKMAKLGEPFAQAHEGHGGTGLGLYICKTLARLHGGSLRIESEGVGLGTTVTVRLPRFKA